MEYVKGEPITAFCDRERLSIPERLALFLQVCEGVHHAHQKGIIHRDLKPSNILVARQDGRAVPKIIDFGVAKATTTSLTERTLYTELGSMVGTLEYMSPEQAQLSQENIDTRSDVYSLGVVLYELLCGALPFDARTLRASGLEEAQRTIRTIDPARPSTRVGAQGTAADVAGARRVDPARLRSQLQGDLDWIVMKALEKDRTRRYDSVSDFAADVRRHLADEPVLASPPSALYRVGKFARRHRGGVAMATAFTVVLVVFVVTILVQTARVTRERDRASREAEAARQVSDFLVGLFEVSDPSEARGNTLTAREILDKGATQIDTGLRSQPDIQARLQTTIATVYTNLGAYSAAEPMLRAAIATLTRTAGAEALSTLSAVHSLADLCWYQRRYAEAETLYRQVVAGRTRLLGADDRDTLRGEYDLASTLIEDESRRREAEQLTISLLERQRRLYGAADIDTISTTNVLATLYFREGRYAEALTMHRDVFEKFVRLKGRDHPNTLIALHGVASDYDRLDQYAEAEPRYRSALEGERRVLGPLHVRTLRTIELLSAMLVRQRRFPDAEGLLLDTIGKLPASDAFRTRLITVLIKAYEEWPRPDEAVRWRAR